MDFELIGPIRDIQPIAIGRTIRGLARLRKRYGRADAGLAMKKRAKQQKYFAVCINNKRYEASLERGKLYRVIPDEDAESHGYLRVVDESGEDYGYSAE